MRIRSLIAVAACGLAACGDERADFEREATAACTSADRALKALGPRSDAGTVESALAAWRRAAEAVAEVEAPAAARPRHVAVVKDARDVERGLRRTALALTDEQAFGRAHGEIVDLRASAESLQTAARKAGLARCGDAPVSASNRLLAYPFTVLVGAAVAEYHRQIERTTLRPRTPEATRRAVDAVIEAQTALRTEVGVFEPPAALVDAHRDFRAEVGDLADVMLPLYDPGRVHPARARRHLRRYEKVHRGFERSWIAYFAQLGRHAE